MRRKHLLSVVLSALPALGIRRLCDVGHGEVLAKQRYGDCAPCRGEDGSGNRRRRSAGHRRLALMVSLRRSCASSATAVVALTDDIDGHKRCGRWLARCSAEEEVKVVAERVAKLPPLQPAVTITDEGRDAWQGHVRHLHRLSREKSRGHAGTRARRICITRRLVPLCWRS